MSRSGNWSLATGSNLVRASATARRPPSGVMAGTSPVIIITHFINPHRFWFKYEASVLNGNASLEQLEVELSKHASVLNQRRLYQSGYEPSIGELVAVKHLTWSKWIRARVDTIHVVDTGTKFVLWATDHGVPFETRSKWIRPLPQTLADRNIVSAFQAGIANIVPATRRLNYMDMTTRTTRIDHWSSDAVRTFEEIVANVETIRFTRTTMLEDPDDENNHIFGHLEFTTYSGIKVDPAKALVEFNYALPLAEKSFDHDIQTEKTRFTPRWLGNDLVKRINDNGTTDNCLHPPPGFDGESEYICGVKKVSDWQMRNQRAPIHEDELDGLDSASAIQSAQVNTVETESEDCIDEKPNLMHYREEDEGEEQFDKRCASRKLNRMPFGLKELAVTDTSSSVGERSVQLETKKTHGSISSVSTKGRFRGQITGKAQPVPNDKSPSIHEPNPMTLDSSKAVNVAMQKLHKRSQLLANLKSPEKPVSPNQSVVESPKSKPDISGPKNPIVNVPKKTMNAFQQAAKQDKCITNSLFLYRVLVHGRNRPRPLENVANANFTKEVHEALQHMRFRDIYRIQAYAWPHIVRGNSLVIVNGPESGKTMAFLPAVCSLVQEKCLDERIPDCEGPICIIVCLSAKKVKKVSGWCRTFMQGSEEPAQRIVEGYGQRNQRKTESLLVNGCSILVCTAPCLERLITDSNVNLFNRSRLQHLVFDDYDLILRSFCDSLKFTLKRLTNIDPTKSRQSPLQLIATSRTWSPTLGLFFKIAQNVALLVGAYAEAAVYARSKVQMELVPKDEKNEIVLLFLMNHNYQEQRTIVVCNTNEEAMLLAERCRSESLMYVLCHDKSSDNEIEYGRNWNAREIPGKLEVLICTDNVLPDLVVSMAQNIVHYSIPNTWTAFSYRFSSMFDYFDDLVMNHESTRDSSLSLILLDENNNTQLPRLIQFMVQHGVQSIDPAVQTLVKRIETQTEEQRNRQLVALCPELVLLGDCMSVVCTMRHTLTEADRSRPAIPRHGVVKLVVMEVLSPVHFSCRLVEHRALGSNDWQRVENSMEYMQFSMRFMNHYGVEENHRTHAAAQLGDLCVVAEDSSYQRCQITDIKKTRMATMVTVYSIDTGKLITSCRDTELLHLEDEFRSFPPQAVQVRIAHCVPCDLDSEWDAAIVGIVQRWLDEAVEGANVHIEGRIELSVMNSLWLDTLRVVEQLPGIDTPVQIMSVGRNLLNKQFAIIDKKALRKLSSMATSVGIWKETADPPVVKAPDVTQQRGRRHRGVENLTPTSLSPSVVSSPLSSASSRPPTVASSSLARKPVRKEHNWAELESDEFQEVYVSTYFSPRLFYVQKYSDILNDVFEAIDQYSELPTSATQFLSDPTVGMLCLAKYNNQLNRAKIVQIACSQTGIVEANLFFLDFGQRLYVPISELYVLPQHLLDIAPFQAILCRLAAVKPAGKDVDWTDLSCDRIFDQVIDVAKHVFVRCVQRSPSNSKYTDGDEFSVLAIDTGGEIDVNLNQRTIDLGLAAIDEKTKHFLEPPKVTVENSELSCVPRSPDDSDASLKELDFDIEFTDEEILSLLQLPSHVKLPDIYAKKESPSTVKVCENRLRAIEPAKSDTTLPVSSKQQFNPIPKLVSPHKIAAVKWQQNHSTIFLTIEAPDVCGYSLDVTNRMLDFRAMLFDNQIVSCLINLYGCIDTEYTSHEIRGLAIRVRLMKTMRGPRYNWSRLTLHEERCRIKYDLNGIDMDEFSGDVKVGREFDRFNGRVNSSSSGSDGDIGSEADFEFDV